MKNGGNSHLSWVHNPLWLRQSQPIYRPANHKRVMSANWRPCLTPHWQSLCHQAGTMKQSSNTSTYNPAAGMAFMISISDLYPTLVIVTLHVTSCHNRLCHNKVWHTKLCQFVLSPSSLHSIIPQLTGSLMHWSVKPETKLQQLLPLDSLVKIVIPQSEFTCI